MRNKFVFRIGGKIFKENAVEITKDAEILYKGKQGSEIPQNLLEEFKTQKIEEKKKEVLKEEKNEAMKTLFKDETTTLEKKVDEIIKYLGLDL